MKAIVLISAVFFLSFVAHPLRDKGQIIHGIQWYKTEYSFGDIPMGPEAKAYFVFRNLRKNPLEIKAVEPGCSCTVSEFTPGEIKARKEGKIIASYRTAGRPGYFKKFVKVTFTDSTIQELVITGNVVP